MAESKGPLAGLVCLLVDDERFNVIAMKRLLKTWGCQVLVANDGADAIAQLEQSAGLISVVLMDIMMPGMDGYAAIRKIRAMPAFADLCVIALTAQAMPGDREQCLDAGATDYLSKPVDADVLAAMIIRHLQLER